MPVTPTSVLDASALLATIQEEPGSDVVVGALASGVAMSLINWAEVLAVVCREGGSTDALISELDT